MRRGRRFSWPLALLVVAVGLLLAPMAGAVPTWLAPQNLSDAGHDSAQVAMDPNGNAIAVWQRTPPPSGAVAGSNGVDAIIQASRYSAATNSWDAPTDLSAADAFGAQVAVDPNGNAIAVWQRVDAAFDDIVQASRYVAATNTWDAPAAATNLSAADQSAVAPQVGLDAAGNALAAWKRSDGARIRIQASRYVAATNAWDAPAAATNLSAAGRDAEGAQVGVDPAGNAVAVWERLDAGSNTVVQAAGFDGAPPTIGAFNVPATGQPGQSVAMSIAATDVFGLGTTTWSFGDGSVFSAGGVGASTTLATSHTYTATGSYTVTVTQADTVGNTSSRSSQLAIPGPATAAAVSPTGSAATPPAPAAAAQPPTPARSATTRSSPPRGPT